MRAWSYSVQFTLSWKQKETNKPGQVGCFSDARCSFSPLAHPASPCGFTNQHCFSTCSVVSTFGLLSVFQPACMYIILSVSLPKLQHVHCADEGMESPKNPYFLLVLMKKIFNSVLNVQKSYEYSARHLPAVPSHWISLVCVSCRQGKPSTETQSMNRIMKLTLMLYSLVNP